MTKSKMYRKLTNTSGYGKVAMSYLRDSDPSLKEVNRKIHVNNTQLAEDYWDNHDEIEYSRQAEIYYAAREYCQYLQEDSDE